MLILIVESQRDLGALWQAHLERQGCEVVLATDEDEAIVALRYCPVDLVVLNLVIDSGGAFAVADFAAYRRPKAKVVFVTNTTFFSDGSIFRHIPNAAAFLPSGTAPEDLAAVVAHHAAPGAA